MLLALQMLPEICLLLGSTVAHGAVELSAGSHTHGQVPGDALPWPGVVVRPLERGGGEGGGEEPAHRCCAGDRIRGRASESDWFT